MEGGTDHDLRILDLPSEEEEERERLAALAAGAEPPKREDLKSLDGDRKPLVEKDKNDKVCLVPCESSPGSRGLCADRKLCHRRRATLPAQKEPPLLQQKARL